MLRRAPTTITLTQPDIDQWEADRKRKVHEAQQKLQDEKHAQSTNDAKSKQKSKKDRIMG
ncbi:nedd8-activating enzyme e1 catalytic subunit [Pyrenophora seminiperda CCB06]|uniref:Nedd8-activating enzyme e1 catalytic subunit n=1 Tax=Pyrenophora seminiperda CCB06 TaxID=1302712 RepID=A0A3M7LXI5_9PLEO|nr:nedd8-activating enzyme e1 catalytic subunit [Pyrenophora seminiperda CCB06]